MESDMQSDNAAQPHHEAVGRDVFQEGAGVWTLNRPVSNQQGYSLLGFVLPHGVDQRLHTPITAALVAVRYGGRYLVGWNRSRRRWELPAGGIEWGESPEACALRELKEESCQVLPSVRNCGLAQARRSTGFHKYTALFFAEVDRLQSFKPNSEWSRIETWDLNARARDFDPLDRLVLQYCDRLVGRS